MKDKECNESNVFTFGYGLCGGITKAECNLKKGMMANIRKL